MFGSLAACTCAEYNAAIAAVGGLEKLHVWSSLTDLDGQYGPPRIFTCWGTEELPIAACDGPPDRRATVDKPCSLDHAVFVVAATEGLT